MERHELFPRLNISVFQMISLFHSSGNPNDSTLNDSRPRFPVPILFRCSVVDSDSVPVFSMYTDSESIPVFTESILIRFSVPIPIIGPFVIIVHTVLRRMLITLFFIHRLSYRCWSMRPCWVIMYT
jgi:hypothetical protein